MRLFCVLCVILASVTHAQLDGTWTLGTNRFTRREKPQAVCHSDTGKITLMAGHSTAARDSDTWVGSPNLQGSFNWAPHHSSPLMEGREAFTMNYALGEYWVFGGKTDARAGVELFYSLVGTEWTPVTLTSTTKPSARYRHHSISLTNGSFVIFSGNGLTKFFNDVWLFNPTDSATGFWTQLHNGTGTAPTARFDPCCEYRSSEDSMVCFGGSSLTGDSDELWEFFMGNLSWTQHATSGTGPSKRRLAHCNMFGDSLSVWSGFSSGISNNTEGDYVHMLSMRTLAWTNTLQTNGPITRDGAATCGNSTHQFLLGGLGVDRSLRNDVWMLSDVSGTMTWQEINPLIDLPFARAEHSGVMIGEAMVVGLGKNIHGKLGDVWKYDTATDFWAKLTSTCPYGARSGAAAVPRGDQVWFVGGELEDGTLTMDIISFDITSLTWAKIPGSNAPPGRHRAAASTVDITRLVVLGGTTSEATAVSDIFIYVPLTQKWYLASQVPESAGTVFPARHSSALIELDTGHLVVLGGAGLTDNLMDRWHVNISAADVSNYEAVYRALPSEIGTAGLEQRSFRRAAAASMGSASHYMVCGGTMSPNFPAIEEDACYQYNTYNGSNVQVAPMPQNSYYPTGMHFGNTFYVFGGTLIQGGVAQPDSYLATLQKFNFSSVCRAGPDTNCMTCSAGTAGPDCAVVPPGSFKSINNSRGVALCSAGQFAPKVASQNGLFCQPCAQGTYQGQVGQSECLPCPSDKTCPVGAIVPLAAENIINKTSFELHPPRLVNAGVPLWAYFGTVISWFGVVIVLSLYLAIEGQLRQSRARYYMREDQVELIPIIYEDLLRYELDERVQREKDREIGDIDDVDAFIKKSNHFRGISVSQVHTALIMFAQEALGLSPLDAEDKVSEEVVDIMLDPFEEFGSPFLTCQEFSSLLCSMFEEMHFPTVEGTRHHKDINVTDPVTGAVKVDPAKSKGKSSLPDFENFDLHPTGHSMFRIGESLSTLKTRAGGVFSVIGWLSISAVITLLCLVFVYDNVEETMAILPDIVFNKAAYVDFTLDVQLSGSVVSSECFVPGTVDTCLDSSSVSKNMDHLVVGSSSVTCRFIEPRDCLMTYTCTNCHFGNSTTSFEFVFGHPGVYSAETSVTLTTQAAISKDYGLSNDGMQHSSIVRRVFSPSNGSIFKGYPSTDVDFVALPTTFSSPRSGFGVSKLETEGYHVYDGQNYKNGNEISVENFRLSRSVPVVINVQPEKKFLVVTRFLKKDLIGLLSSILGCVSGLGAVTLFIIQFYDSNVRWMKLDIKNPAAEQQLTLRGSSPKTAGELNPFIQVAGRGLDSEEASPASLSIQGGGIDAVPVVVTDPEQEADNGNGNEEASAHAPLEIKDTSLVEDFTPATEVDISGPSSPTTPEAGRGRRASVIPTIVAIPKSATVKASRKVMDKLVEAGMTRLAAKTIVDYADSKKVED